MSMMKPAAIHRSSVGMIDNMTTRTGGFTNAPRI
jgi:hypothetical protein